MSTLRPNKRTRNEDSFGDHNERLDDAVYNGSLSARVDEQVSATIDLAIKPVATKYGIDIVRKATQKYFQEADSGLQIVNSVELESLRAENSKLVKVDKELASVRKELEEATSKSGNAPLAIVSAFATLATPFASYVEIVRSWNQLQPILYLIVNPLDLDDPNLTPTNTAISDRIRDYRTKLKQWYVKLIQPQCPVYYLNLPFNLSSTNDFGSGHILRQWFTERKRVESELTSAANYSMNTVKLLLDLRYRKRCLISARAAHRIDHPSSLSGSRQILISRIPLSVDLKTRNGHEGLQSPFTLPVSVVQKCITDLVECYKEFNVDDRIHGCILVAHDGGDQWTPYELRIQDRLMVIYSWRNLDLTFELFRPLMEELISHINTSAIDEWRTFSVTNWELAFGTDIPFVSTGPIAIAMLDQLDGWAKAQAVTGSDGILMRAASASVDLMDQTIDFYRLRHFGGIIASCNKVLRQVYDESRLGKLSFQ